MAGKASISHTRAFVPGSGCFFVPLQPLMRLFVLVCFSPQRFSLLFITVSGNAGGCWVGGKVRFCAADFMNFGVRATSYSQSEVWLLARRGLVVRLLCHSEPCRPEKNIRTQLCDLRRNPALVARLIHNPSTLTFLFYPLRSYVSHTTTNRNYRSSA